MRHLVWKGRSRRGVQACLALLIVMASLLPAGCGGRGSTDLSAPAQPGSAAELAGTRWTNPDTKVAYYFEDEANVQIIVPDQADPVLSVYSVDNGIVDITVGMTSQGGTWDGKKLVLEGTALKQE